MYILKYDGDVLHDPRTGDVVTDWSCDMAVNEAGSMTVTVPRTHPLVGTFAVMSAAHEVVLYEDGEELFRGRITDIETGIDGSVELKCEGQLAYLNDTVIRPYGTYEDEEQGWTVLPSRAARDVFGWYIGQHNAMCNAEQVFEVIENGITDEEITRSSTQYPTTGAEIRDKILDHGLCYIYASGYRQIHAIADGRDNDGQDIRLGRNLVDCIGRFDVSDMVTAIIPVGTIETGDGDKTSTETVTLDGVEDGAYGKGYTIVGDRIQSDEGVRLHGVIEDKRSYDATSVDNLAAQAMADLADSDHPIESMTVKAVDLHKIDPAIRPLRLGEYIRVHGILPTGGGQRDVDQWLMCMGVSLDADPERCEYQLGSTEPTYTDRTTVAQRTQRARVAERIVAVDALSEEAKAGAADAQEAAEAAQQVAHTKRRVFTVRPTPPYDVGDLWVQAVTDDGGGDSNILVCVMAREE